MAAIPWWQQLLQPFAHAGVNKLLGTGLLLGGGLMDKEPGEVGEARQFSRNVFTSPTFLPERVSQLSQTNQQYFDPLIQKQRKQAISDISQRFAAAFPNRVGAQGPEFGAISKYLTDESLPSERAFYGDLGLKGFAAQQQSARDILANSKPDPTAATISQLGGALLTRDILGGSPFGVPGASFGRQIGPWAGDAISQAAGQLLGQAVADYGRQLPNGGVELLDAGRRVIGIVGTDGTVSSPGGQGVVGKVPVSGAPVVSGAGPAAAGGVDFGLPGPGLLGPAGLTSGRGLLSTAGSAGAGFAVGSQTGPATVKLIDQLGLEDNRFARAVSPIPHFGEQGQAATGGAVGGAAAGFATGGPGGAAAGAVSGAVGGFRNQREAEHAAKAQRRAADLASQGSNFDQFASFWMASLGAAGVDTTEFDQFIASQRAILEGPPAQASFQGQSFFTDQAEAVAHAGGLLLLQSIQAKNPSIQSLDQVPGFRSSYIEWARTHIQNDPTAGIEWGLRKAGY